MRRSFLVAFSLTLFALLLVLLAAFFFSYQNQQLLQQRLLDTHRDNEATIEMATRQAADLEQIRATRQAAVDALATAEAEAVLLEGQLVVSQQQADELRRQIDTLNDMLSALEDTAATREAAQAISQPPLVAIGQPGNNQTVALGESLPVVVVASDRSGLAEVQLEIDGSSFSEAVAAGNTIFAYIQEWTPTAVGEVSILARATNINGQTTEALPVTVQVVAATQE